MTDLPVSFSSEGIPQTVLEPEPPDALRALDDALAQSAGTRRDAVSAVVARFPRFLDGWARLGELARDDVEAYACFRVGYHRGLDRLRQSGWRGSGYVRWEHETNRGFLCALDGLRRTAAAIGEADEEQRCNEFLHQLEPGWDRIDRDEPE
jgi:hypothetical protein